MSSFKVAELVLALGNLGLWRVLGFWGSGAIAAIVVCCGWGGRKTTNFGGVVPLLGAIAAEGKGG